MKARITKLFAAVVAAVVSATTLLAADTFPSWVKDVRQERTWRTGKLANYEKTYSARIAKNPADYEARILHAATLVAGVVESKDAKAFLSQFGYTLNFPGLKVSHVKKPMAQWPKPNALADTFVKNFVPPLKQALEDLEAIPEDWAGSVALAANDYGFDEDVEVDCGDVLYAKCSLEALIGGAYFVQGSDIVLDWKKIGNIIDTTTGRKVPILSEEPSDDPYDLLYDEEFWSQTLRMRPKNMEPENEGAEQSIAFVGNKLYIRSVAPYKARNDEGFENYEEDPEDPPDIYLKFENESAKKWAFFTLMKMWYYDDEEEDYVSERVFVVESNLDNKIVKGDWSEGFRKLALPYESAVEFDGKGMKTVVLVVDFTSRKALMKENYWEVDDAGAMVWKYGTFGWWGPNEDGYWDDESGEWVYLYGEWVYDEEEGYDKWVGEYTWHEEEGWSNRYFEFDTSHDKDSMRMEALTASGAYTLKVRNASMLQSAKEYFRAALKDAQLADERVLAREDEAMHFVEYDKAVKKFYNKETDEYEEFDPMPELRKATAYALAALDETAEVDFNEFSPIPAKVFGGKSGYIQLSTLIPNGGVTEVFLGALFSGKLTHAVVPKILAEKEYGDANIVYESVADPTVAGLFPQFGIWDFLYAADRFHFGYVHAPVAITLDATGGTVKKAKTGKTTATFLDEIESFMMDALPTPDARKGWRFDGWWTSATGGEEVNDYFVFEDVSFFQNPSSPTLYAHWLKVATVTMKTPGTTAYFEAPAPRGDYYNASNENAPTKPFEVVEGWTGNISAAEYKTTKNSELQFWKWTVTPSTANLGPEFIASEYDTNVIMPGENITFTAEYIDPDTCGYVRGVAYADSVETDGDVNIEPPYESFEWSPDGGKTWYKNEVSALVKKGKATITWRSTDPHWAVYDADPKTLNVSQWTDYTVNATFAYVPEVVVDFYDQTGKTTEAVGTVTLNPNTGFVPPGTALSLTAKAAKGYSFQGWALASIYGDEWTYSDGFLSTAATYKLENKRYTTCYIDDYEEIGGCIQTDRLRQYLNVEDMKVHVIAVFKANTAYSKGDIVITGGGSSAGIVQTNPGGDATGLKVLAVTGCALDGVALEFAAEAYPLTYKLTGKLPAGAKFDAKTGVFKGAPTKSGTFDVVVTATDPNKNSVSWPVQFVVRDMPSWLVGVWRFMDYNGYAEISVSSAGKVSVKYQNRKGSISYSGNLSWTPGMKDSSLVYELENNGSCGPEEQIVDEDAEGEFGFYVETKDLSECDLYFYPHAEEDESGVPYVDGYIDLYVKADADWYGSDGSGRKLVESLLADGFKDKYYTAAVAFNEYDGEAYNPVTGTGYAYLTVKTDKKGGAKVTGMLPDGEKLSMSGTLLPYYNEDEELVADLCLFAAPSKYKKEGYFAVKLVISEDGLVLNDWDRSCYLLPDGFEWTPDVFSGALYSAAATLEDWYFRLSGRNNGEPFLLAISYKDGKETIYENIEDVFYGAFSVTLAGDKKGGIAVPKSPAPWKDGNEWNYEADKNGNEITNPSQIAFTFAKATGIFSGNAMANFDYYNEKDVIQHKTAKIPYNGVFVKEGGDESEVLNGYGAGIYSTKLYYYDDDMEKYVAKPLTVSLPVTIERE